LKGESEIPFLLIPRNAGWVFMSAKRLYINCIEKVGWREGKNKKAGMRKIYGVPKGGFKPRPYFVPEENIIHNPSTTKRAPAPRFM
jgi:hypothetical protein